MTPDHPEDQPVDSVAGIAPAKLRIGEFAVDASSNEIHGSSGVVRLRPLIMQVLLRLAQAPGAAVSREQLINDVWSRKIVNDEVLSRAIGELRTALGDDSREPRYIETLPKVGYRLVAQVSRADLPDEVETQAPSTEVPQDIPRKRPALAMAVLVIGLAAIAWISTHWKAAPPVEPDWSRQINAARPFASDPAAELAPRFSPDGSKIVYVLRHEDRSEVVIQEIKSGTRRTVDAGSGIVTSPVFFPDGQRLAYWRQADNDCEIVEHELKRNTRKTLLDCKLNPQPRFDLSPDGRQLVFAARERADYPSGLMLLDIASGNRNAITQPQPGEGSDVLPRFSPDGRRIAFFRGSESHQRVWLIDAMPPHSAIAATTVEGLSYGLAWTASQGPLLVAADWPGFRALNRLDLATGATSLLGARGARFPDIARNGDLVYESATYRADLWLTDTREPGKQRELLWPSTRYSNQPEFSPDGKQVVFSSNREGTDALFIGALGGAARRLPLPAGFRYIRPHWSPDGKTIYAVRIAATDSKPSQQQAIRFDVESGAHQVLGDEGQTVNAIHALANGDLLIGEIADYAMRLSRHAPGGDRKRLALPLVSEYAIAGNTLVYTLPQLQGATRCDLTVLHCTPLNIALNDEVRFDWTLSRDAIWYLGRDDKGKRALLRHDLASGNTSAHDFAPSGAGTSLAVSPDGTRMIVVREAPPVIDLMLAPRITTH